MTEIWIVIAIGCAVTGYAAYLRNLLRARIRPSRASWLIWSLMSGVAALTGLATASGPPAGPVLLLSALCCAVIALISWRRSGWVAPNRVEATCIAGSILALTMAVAWPGATAAPLLVAGASSLGFWLTLTSLRRDPGRELPSPWGLWAAASLFALFAVLGRDMVSGALVVAAHLAGSAAIWLVASVGTSNPAAAFRHVQNGLSRFDRYRHNRNLFALRESHLGWGVYARCRFAAGAELVRFTRHDFPPGQVPGIIQDHAMRGVGAAVHRARPFPVRLRHSINHSCDPNAGLRFTDDGAVLVALRDIYCGDEISWDYSTALAQSNWHMICQCRSDRCRRVIGNFDTLDAQSQAFFRSRNLIAPHLRRSDDINPTRRIG